MNGMALVAVAAIAFALVALLVALSFVRWSLRTIARKDAKIDELRQESMERYARLVGQQIESTPREKQAARESAVHQARRELASSRIIENIEQSMEIPSPSEARHNERMIYEELRERSRWEPEGWGPHEPLADAPDAEVREALFVDVGVEAAL